MSETHNPVLTFTVLGRPYATPWNAIPVGNQVACAIRQIKHILGNESYAAAGKTVETELGLGEESTKQEKTDALAKFRDEQSDRWAELVHAEADKRWEILLRGTMSATDRTRISHHDRVYFRLVDAELTKRLKGAKDPEGNAIRLPTNDTTEVVFEDGSRINRAEMRESVIEEFGHEYFEEKTQAILAIEKEGESEAPVEAPKSASMFRRKAA